MNSIYRINTIVKRDLEFFGKATGRIIFCPHLGSEKPLHGVYEPQKAKGKGVLLGALAF